MTKREKDPMDGAVYPGTLNKTPEDFFSDSKTGLRPNSTSRPHGSVFVDLSESKIGKTIPPRAVWTKGSWKALVNKGARDKDWATWVVSGEGTPGNYEEREYLVPWDEAANERPRHPSQWPKKYEKKGGSPGWAPKGSYGSYGSYGQSGYTGKGTATASSGVPWGVRVRCVGCGHFYKMDSLADHAKNACPGTQDPPALWVMACECHPDNLLATAEVLPGFPMKPPEKKDDMAGDLKDAAAEKKEPEGVASGSSNPAA